MPEGDSTIVLDVERVHGNYMHSCINCHGENEDYRLSRGLPCIRCIPDVIEQANIENLYKIMKKIGTLKKTYRELYELHRGLEELNKLFYKTLESRPWSAQRTWATRVLKGESFSIVAPTGVGKTLFGMIMSLYLGSKNKKCYIIVPTTPLVNQVYERLIEFSDRAGLNIDIVAYHSKIKSRRKVLKKIRGGEFNILVTTSQFIARRFDALEGTKFHFIFVDDVDAILRSSRNIDRVLQLLGFTKESISTTLELIRLKTNIVRTRDDEERKNLLSEIEKLKKKLGKLRKGDKGILIVSSATGRPRGMRVKLFRELLGFQVGYRSETLRNIVDAYIHPGEDGILEVVYKLVSRLGGGGLVYVPVDKGIEYAEEVARYLRKKGITAEVFTSGKLDIYNKFVDGKIDVLVGVAIYYGVMVRGLDLPQRIRYAIFVGIPRFKFSAKFEEPRPIQMLRTLGLLRELVESKEKEELDKMLRILNRIVKTSSFSALEKLTRVLRGEAEASTKTEKTVLNILEYIRSKLSDPVIRERLKKLSHIQVLEENGEFYILIPDLMTYIQASGRTSRLYAGGITRGLAVSIIDYPNLLEGLMRKMRWIIEETSWVDFNEIDIEKLIEEVDRDREMVKKVVTGEIKREIEDPVKTALMVVESPNKARTIARFFGRPTVRKRDGNTVYEVSIGNLILMITASGGHVYDLITLPKKIEYEKGLWHGVYVKNDEFIPLYNSIKRCLSCGHQFTSESIKCPKCGSDLVSDSLNRVRFLQDLATEVDIVLIATDPDVEGEKIGWDIAMLLRPYTKNIHRLEFHEITRKAILKALKEQRGFLKRYVEAQIVRRIEDRWIGFVLTGKLKTEFRKQIGDKHWYRWRKGEWSAGRVQTPVLGWIIKRWREVENSRAKVFMIKLPYDLYIELKEDDVSPRLRNMVGETEFTVEGGEKYVEEINPPPPFTTDMLIQEANRVLKIGADQVMRLAQDLFEQGLITYHRTDSSRVSDAGIQIAKEYLQHRFGEAGKRLFKPRKWGEGGAHECIRPTRPIDTETLIDLVMQGDMAFGIMLTKMHYRLYSLIFNRFIASQMAPAKTVKQNVKVRLMDKEVLNEDRIVEILDEGFLKIYGFTRVKSQAPARENVRPISVETREKFLVPGYTQGDVIKLMKEKEIGRPSTYAKIVKTLLDRRYVFESKNARWLIPRPKGEMVYSYLSQRYGHLVSEDRTRITEKFMLEIEMGKRDYMETLREIYKEIKEVEEASPELKEYEEDYV